VKGKRRTGVEGKREGVKKGGEGGREKKGWSEGGRGGRREVK